MKNQYLAQLFQVANVNPLAGCLPAFVQIPIFISLYRALQNLVAENKLDEPFLWIPDLEGPVFRNSPETSMNWIKSVFSGNPLLGWHDTLAYLSIPFILYISQSISQKVLQPPKDPNKVLTEQEQVSQGILNYLPVMIAFFSINVPAGLGIYWVFNNILTTVVTISIRNKIKDEPLPAEVSQLMATIDATGSSTSKTTRVSKSAQEIFDAQREIQNRKTTGFGKVTDTEIIETAMSDTMKNSEESNTSDNTSSIVTEVSNESDGSKKETKKSKKKRN